jgi:carboxypeptidase C (cathepsin A)
MLFVDQPVGVGYSYSKSGTLDELRFNSVRAARELAVFLSHFFGVDCAASSVAAVLHLWRELRRSLCAAARLSAAADADARRAARAGHRSRQRVGLARPCRCRRGPPLPSCTSSSAVSLRQWSTISPPPVSRLCAAAITVRTAVSCNGVVGIVLLNNPGMEIYDIRKRCPGTFDHDCYNMTAGHQWVRSAAAKQRLGVPASSSWQNLEIELVVMAALNGDDMDQFAKLLPPILASGTRVMAYNGMYDLLCNWIGTEQYLSIVGGAAFNSSRRSSRGRSTAGRDRRADRSLTFVKIDNSGHMAPRQSASGNVGHAATISSQRNFPVKSE